MDNITIGIVIGSILTTLLWLPLKSEYIDPEITYQAYKICEENEGVKTIEIDPGLVSVNPEFTEHSQTDYDITCNNGAHFYDVETQNKKHPTK